jgi:hypothetical protein
MLSTMLPGEASGDEIAHLGDLAPLRLDDFVGQLTHARVAHLRPLGGHDGDRVTGIIARM